MRLRSARVAVLACILLQLFTACRKEVSTEHPGQNVGEGSFTANIDGVVWSAADNAKSATILGGMINLTGVSADNKQISITLNDSVTGPYVLDQGSQSFAAYVDVDSSAVYAFSSNQGTDTTQAGGMVNVTEIDTVNKTITGNFSFKLWRDIDGKQKVVKTGVFNKIPYTAALPATSGDTLESTIDGVAWKAANVIGSAFSNQLTISGSDINAHQSVGLVMPQDITPGNYALDYRAATYYGIYKALNGNGMASTSGTLTILSNDVTAKRVRGNFSFTAVNPLNPADPSHALAGGYFSVSYN